MWRLVLVVIFSSLKFGSPGPVIDGENLAKDLSEKLNTSDTENDETKTPFRFSYSGYQLLKTNITKDFLNDIEKEYGIEVWRARSAADETSDILVPPDYIKEIVERIAQDGAEFKVVIKDLESAISEESPDVDEELGIRESHGMSWDRYHKLEDINGYLVYLATLKPELCQVIRIGPSSEGREMLVLKVSSRKGARTKPGIWIDGGIHAREWISPASVTYALRELVENYEDHPELIDSVDWYFLPVVNPDGYEYTFTGNRLWRKSRSMTGSIRCRGVDLNRNFGYEWGGEGTSREPCSDIYRGSKAFSEPETKAMSDLIQEISASLKVYLTFHSYGEYFLIPWGYKEKIYPRDFEEMRKLANVAVDAIKGVSGSVFKSGQSADLLYAAAGGSDDWAKSIGIPYAYTVELRDKGTHGFILPPKFIVESGKETYEAVKAISRYIAA